MKRVVYKFLSVLITFSMLISILAGCAEKTPEDDKVEDVPKLLSSDCKIIYPTDMQSEMFSHILKLQENIENISGFSLKLSNDYIASEEENSDVQEIIVGNTVRKESAEVMADIGFFDYAIKSIGNKIVVAAHTEEMLYKAMLELSGSVLTISEGNVVIGDDVVFESDTEGFFEKYGKLSEYRIVYPKGDNALLDAAQNIVSKLKKRYSVELPVVDDGELPNGYEILIGSTNRALFGDYYRGDKKPDALHYAICAREGNLLVCGGNQRSTEIACQRFIGDFGNTFWSPVFEVQSDIEQQYVAYDYNDAHAKRSDDTDIRIMTYNILSKELSPDAADFEERSEMVLSTILNYAPDVVGLQEVSEKAYGIIENYIGNKYAIPLKKTPNGEYSFTGLMYNTETVKYIEGGNHIYSVGNKRIRIISWGLFEMKSTGKQFLALSTHWDIVLDNRPIQAAEMTNFVNDLVEKYNCPVFTTGDFNTLDSVGYYKDYVSKTGQTDARYDAQTVGYQAKGDIIDHITATSKDTCTLFYKHLDTDLSAKASDHDPVYADYKFE